MSQTHEGQWTFSLGNPFCTILHKGSHLSPKLRAVLHSFEEKLSENLKNLKPKSADDVVSLCWMRSAVEFLAEAYALVKMLINELQFPSSDWDEKWIDIYLDSSVKLLDVCNALSSELSHIGHGQLLLQYVLHILDTSKGFPSSEQLRRAHSTLHDWMAQVSSGNSKLYNSATILQSLQQEDLYLPKVRKSAKGKVLIRALYGVKVMTVFICSIFATVLSGCSKPLLNLPISDKFLWFEAFSDLQSFFSEEVKRQFLCGKARIFKELEAVESCVSRLHAFTNTVACSEQLLQQVNDTNHFKEKIVLNESADTEVEYLKVSDGPSKFNGDISYVEEVVISEKSGCTEEALQESKNSSVHIKDIDHVEEAMIPNRSVDTEEGLEESKELLHQCNSINYDEEVLITEKRSASKQELSNCKKSLLQTNGVDYVLDDQIPEKTDDTKTEVSQDYDKPLPQISDISHVWDVVPEKVADPDGGLQECISSLAERVAVLGNELDTVSKQINYFFRNVLSGRDALLCNFRASGATEETKVNNTNMNG